MRLFSAPAKPAVRSPADFVPVAVQTLLPSKDIPFDLFIRPGRSAPLTLYRECNYPLTLGDLENLIERDVHTLYIEFACKDAYGEYLRSALLDDSVLSVHQRYHMLHAATQSILEDAFSGSSIAKTVAVLTPVARQIVDCVCAEEAVFRELFALMAHDYCTYTHASNVAMLSVTLASRLGISSHDELAAIATGGLLHDLGKRQLPACVLNKREKLTPQEIAIVRRHPQTGFEELCQQPNVSWPQLMMVYQHHERLDGTGYPARVDSSEIHHWAKICMVADTFDAMTSERPYRHALPVDYVLNHCHKKAERHFDPEIVQCLSRIMSNSSS
jgi:HD-GYP domain-containing protein (c-di-GMP phosphodiesterase class II)